MILTYCNSETINKTRHETEFKDEKQNSSYGRHLYKLIYLTISITRYGAIHECTTSFYDLYLKTRT